MLWSPAVTGTRREPRPASSPRRVGPSAGVAAAPARVLASLFALALPALAPGCRRENASAPQPAAAPSPPTAEKGEPSASEPSPPAPTPTAVIAGGKHRSTYYLQVARTAEERQNGLMGRPTLASDAGLLFVFPAGGPVEISAKEYLIAVDLLFIGQDRRIVGLVEGVPAGAGTPARSPSPLARYVLALRAGQVAAGGFAVGGTVELLALPES